MNRRNYRAYRMFRDRRLNSARTVYHPEWNTMAAGWEVTAIVTELLNIDQRTYARYVIEETCPLYKPIANSEMSEFGYRFITSIDGKKHTVWIEANTNTGRSDICERIAVEVARVITDTYKRAGESLPGTSTDVTTDNNSYGSRGTVYYYVSADGLSNAYIAFEHYKDERAPGRGFWSAYGQYHSVDNPDYIDWDSDMYESRNDALYYAADDFFEYLGIRSLNKCSKAEYDKVDAVINNA